MAENESKLEAAYLATTFNVETPTGDIGIRVGQISRRLDLLLLQLGASEWAYVTAWNPGSTPTSADQNASAQAKLLQVIRDRGFAFHEGDGIPDKKNWAPERSVWIAGISRLEAVELGRQFAQNAIVVGSLGGVAELRWLR